MGHRTELQREVAEALVSSKAIDFEAVGSIIARYGARAASQGDAIGVIINHRVMDACIPVDFYSLLPNLTQQATQSTKR